MKRHLPLFFAALVAARAIAQTPTPPAPAGTSQSCKIDRSPALPGDDLLAARKYTEAERVYREAIAKDPAAEDNHLGLTRALIGQDQVDAARAEAASMLQAHPHSAVAEVAMSEAAYRAADVQAAVAHANAALMANVCDGRASAAMAKVLDLAGYEAKVAQRMKTAHALRPNDELITRDWIDSLPRKQRQVELTKYLEGQHALSAADERSYDNELEHLKARRPNECHISSKSDVVKTGMQPIFGDHTEPQAFGLDVFFDGKRRRMQIDTGASGILLTQSAARALNLVPEFHLKASGVGDEGDRDSFLAHVHNIRIGDVEITDCMVEVVAKSKLDVDGLIGMDVFSHWLVTLDYQNAQLQLSPLPARPGSSPVKKLESDPLPGDIGDEEAAPHDPYVAPEMKDWTPVLRIGHEILLPARIKTGPTHYLVMDTGAGASSVSIPMGKEASKLHGSEVEFTGISGKVKKVYETSAVPLQVGSFLLPPIEYYAYDITSLSHDNGFETSGLFGLPTLQRLTIRIDYRDNLLKLTYDPAHDKQRF